MMRFSVIDCVDGKGGGRREGYCIIGRLDGDTARGAENLQANT